MLHRTQSPLLKKVEHEQGETQLHNTGEEGETENLGETKLWCTIKKQRKDRIGQRISLAGL